MLKLNIKSRAASVAAAAALLLSMALPNFAQAQVMSYTGASPATFSGPGQVITFTLNFDQSNAITNTISLVSMSHTVSALTCSGLPLAPFGTSTCTYTYTTTAADVSNITQFGSFTTTTNGAPRGGSISNQQVVTYVPPVATPSASIAVTPASVSEDGAANLVYTVSLSGASATTTVVNIGTGGTATSGTDYTGSMTTVSIPAGNTTGTITIKPSVDTAIEADETVILTVAAGTGYTVGAPASANGTILNDDLPNLTINDVSVTEGGSGTVNAVFTVSLSAPAGLGGVTFNIATANGTATAGSDYTAQTLTSQTIPAGSSSYTFTVVVNGDTLNEINESFFVNVTSATNAVTLDGQAVGTITNDDAVPSLSINDVSIAEGNSGTTNATFTVSLNAASGQTVSVNYATANGTATQPADYSNNSGTLTFTPGQTTQTITVPVIGETVPEANETFFVNLSGATNATISDNQGLGTINNDDVPVTVSPATLPNGTVAAAYSQAITASGGAGPYSFAVTAGALPTGLSLSLGGTLSGTPTAGGTFNFTIAATDSSGAPGPYSGSQAYTVTIAAPTLALPATALAGGTLSSAYSTNITAASGGTSPYSYAVTSGALPGGLTLNVATGAITGTPNALGSFNFSITATDSSTGTGPYTASQSYSIVVIAMPPVASNSSLTVAYNAAATNVSLNITGGSPTSVSIATPASNGTAIATGTTITYQPTTGFAGTDSFTYTATNSGGTSAPATVTITVNDPVITITASGGFAATVAAPYTQTFTWNSGAQPWSSYQVTNLPAGLSITGTTANSVTISGTPTQAGSFNLNASATDSSTGNGPYTVGQAFALTVSAPSLSLSPAATTFTPVYAAAFSQAFTAAGGTGPYTYAVTGTLPTGLMLSGNTVSGTPTQPGNYVVLITATDTGSTGTGSPFSIGQSYTFSVAAPTIVLNPTALPNTTAGLSYSETLTASGGVAPYTFAITAGALPNGLTLSSSGSLLGTITASGTFNFTVTATDANAQTGSRAYAVVVAVPAIALTPATLPAGTAGTAYSQTLTIAGGIAPYTVTQTGTLPTGITFNTATRTFSGTPTQSGTFNISVTATDSTGGTAATVTNNYTLVIAAPTLALSPSALPAGTQFTPYPNTAFAASGGVAPYSYSITAGSLPSGLSFSAAGVLNGRPLVSGTFNFTVTVTDSTSGTAGTISAAYQLVIANLPDPSTDAEVRGLIESQIASTRRFATAQVNNFQRHLEGLHSGRDKAGFDNQIGFAGAASGTPCIQNSVGLRLDDVACDRTQPAANGHNANSGKATADANAAFNVWAAGSIRSGNQDAQGGAASFDFETDGLSLGIDKRLSSTWVIGAGAGYGRDESRVGNNGTSNEGEAFTMALYSSYHPNQTWFVDSLLGYQQIDYRLRRYVTANGNTVFGQRDANQLFASITVGGDFHKNQWSWSPYARWDLAQATLDAYEESGDAFYALSYDELDVDTNTLSLGFRSSYETDVSWGSISPQFRLEYQRDFQGDSTTRLQYAALTSGPIYDAVFYGYDRNRWVFGLGANMQFNSGWRFNFEMESTGSSGSDNSQGIQMNLEKSF